MAAIIEVRGVVNRFGAQVVHGGLDADIRKGEVFGIVGGSGSGKSVLLRTMLGLQKPASGSVRIEGEEVAGRPERELLAVKRRYGVMFQRGALFTSLTVQQNVELPVREHFVVPDSLLADLALLRLRMAGLSDDAAAKYPAQPLISLPWIVVISQCTGAEIAFAPHMKNPESTGYSTRPNE